MASRVVVVFFAVVFATGCATPSGHYDNTVTGAVAGGLIGGAVAGNKGARVGALLGTGIGILSDSQNRKDNERAEKIGGLIYSKTGGGNDSGAAQAAATAEANLAFAEEQRRRCEAKYAVYSRHGVRVPHDCQAEFNRALADADYTAEVNSPEVFHATMRGRGGVSYGYSGVRPGSPHEAYWRYWDSVGPYYNMYGPRRY
jgi:hypothetical protein